MTVIGFVALSAFIAAEEFSQRLFHSRGFSWLDMGMSLLGAGLFSFPAWRLGRRVARRREEEEKS